MAMNIGESPIRGLTRGLSTGFSMGQQQRQLGMQERQLDMQEQKMDMAAEANKKAEEKAKKLQDMRNALAATKTAPERLKIMANYALITGDAGMHEQAVEGMTAYQMANPDSDEFKLYDSSIKANIQQMAKQKNLQYKENDDGSINIFNPTTGEVKQIKEPTKQSDNTYELIAEINENLSKIQDKKAKTQRIISQLKSGKTPDSSFVSEISTENPGLANILSAGKRNISQEELPNVIAAYEKLLSDYDRRYKLEESRLRGLQPATMQTEQSGAQQPGRQVPQPGQQQPTTPAQQSQAQYTEGQVWVGANPPPGFGLIGRTSDGRPVYEPFESGIKESSPQINNSILSWLKGDNRKTKTIISRDQKTPTPKSEAQPPAVKAVQTGIEKLDRKAKQGTATMIDVAEVEKKLEQSGLKESSPQVYHAIFSWLKAIVKENIEYDPSTMSGGVTLPKLRAL